MEAQRSAHRERIPKGTTLALHARASVETELACCLERETALVNAAKLQVVSDGINRYPEQSGQVTTRRVATGNELTNWVVPRRELFVPDVDEGFFVFPHRDPLPEGEGIDWKRRHK